MSEHKFRQFQVEHGTYYLIPKAELDAILEQLAAKNKIQIAHTEPPTFGHLLCIFRKARKLSFAELARDSQVKLRTLKDQENKGSKPQKKNLDKLCQFFGNDFEDQLPEDLKKLRRQGVEV